MSSHGQRRSSNSVLLINLEESHVEEGRRLTRPRMKRADPKAFYLNTAPSLDLPCHSVTMKLWHICTCLVRYWHTCTPVISMDSGWPSNTISVLYTFGLRTRRDKRCVKTNSAVGRVQLRTFRYVIIVNEQSRGQLSSSHTSPAPKVELLDNRPSSQKPGSRFILLIYWQSGRAKFLGITHSVKIKTNPAEPLLVGS